LIFVDSSVWIDYFRGVSSRQTDRLDDALGAELVATGDIVLTEVLQGFDADSDFDKALRVLGSLIVIDVAGRDIAIRAARNFRTLRTRGVTVRKTIDTLIATRCIESGYALLYSNRDFDPFVEHLGLASALSAS
jgi:predicted nucleic acid-binding protein